jgi:hypothetical protein
LLIAEAVHVLYVMDLKMTLAVPWLVAPFDNMTTKPKAPVGYNNLTLGWLHRILPIRWAEVFLTERGPLYLVWLFLPITLWPTPCSITYQMHHGSPHNITSIPGTSFMVRDVPKGGTGLRSQEYHSQL